MRYQDPELIDRLASAYVLGTLSGPARKRFERLALEAADPAIAQAIWRWERHLNPLADNVAPLKPRARSWRAIRARLDHTGERAFTARLWLWRGLTAAMAIALLLTVVPYRQPTYSPEHLALIQDDAEQPLWAVVLDTDTGILRMRAINAPAREVDRVFQLWLLPATGQPQPVALLPLSKGVRGQSQLSSAVLALLANAQGLAVSVEPPGGSPTGLPTGPVVYTAPNLEL